MERQVVKVSGNEMERKNREPGKKEEKTDLASSEEMNSEENEDQDPETETGGVEAGENTEQEVKEKGTEEVNKLQQLQEQVQYLKQEKEETWDMLQRVKADFDNYRRRTKKEKEEAGFNAVFSFIQKLLPVLDNMERALENARKEEVDTSFLEGLEMIKKQMDQVLQQEGVIPIEAEGRQFDPNVHEAVMKTEEGKGDPNTVMEVFQTGYLMQGKVLRPALVRVFVGESEGQEKGEDSEGTKDKEKGENNDETGNN